MILQVEEVIGISLESKRFTLEDSVRIVGRGSLLVTSEKLRMPGFGVKGL